MRKLVNNDSSFEFPDSVVFAFNPLYCTFSTILTLSAVKFSVVCNNVERNINVQLLNGKANIYF